MDFVTTKPVKGYSLTDFSVEVGVISLKDVLAVYTLQGMSTETMLYSAVKYKLDTNSTELLVQTDLLYTVNTHSVEVILLPPPIYFLVDTQSTELIVQEDRMYLINTKSVETIIQHPADIPTPMTIHNIAAEIAVEVKTPKASIEELSVHVALDGGGESGGNLYSVSAITGETGLATNEGGAPLIGEMRTEIGIYMPTIDSGNGFEGMGIEVGLY